MHTRWITILLAGTVLLSACRDDRDAKQQADSKRREDRHAEQQVESKRREEAFCQMARDKADRTSSGELIQQGKGPEGLRDLMRDTVTGATEMADLAPPEVATSFGRALDALRSQDAILASVAYDYEKLDDSEGVRLMKVVMDVQADRNAVQEYITGRCSVTYSFPGFGFPNPLYFPIGTCLNMRPSAEGSPVPRMTRVSCESPHDYETYAIKEMPAAEGAPFPGTDALQDFANCQAEYDGSIDRERRGVTGDYVTLSPDEEAWRDGLHTVACAATSPGSKLVGSKRKAA